MVGGIAMKASHFTNRPQARKNAHFEALGIMKKSLSQTVRTTFFYCEHHHKIQTLTRLPCGFRLRISHGVILSVGGAEVEVLR